MADLVGQSLLNRYYLREHVGSGGMADVYATWDNLRSVKLAVKVLRRDLANNPRFFQMFAQEAELLRKLEHPNIVRLYEFERQGEFVFIVMDWVEGTNLRQSISDRKEPHSLEEASEILLPIISALHYAHQNKVYHCDVKPANILLHVDGRALLTDFGVARLAAEEGGGGTPPYMAPEQFSGEGIDGRTDVYALGITVFEMLTGGVLPFRGITPDSVGTTTKERIGWEHIYCSIPSPRSFNGSIPESIENVILTALAKHKNARFSTPMALWEAFEHARAVSGRSGRARRPSIERTFIAPEPSPRKPRVRSRLPSTPARRPHDPDKRRELGIIAGQPHLFGRGGELAGHGIPITSNGLTIGRSGNNHVQIRRDRSVSRLHARIIRTRRGVYIRDENSSLGTFVNGQKVAGPTALNHRDVIRIGYYNEFEYRER
ncbi:MAG: protein kinase [Anaerolineales bacterium]|nr:protein kinase [Anaerolineales bacterium]